MSLQSAFVPLTDSRHDGQVYGWVMRRLFFAEAACQVNHSLKHDPQKVCRQSSSVSGWYRISVHIYRMSASSCALRLLGRQHLLSK